MFGGNTLLLRLTDEQGTEALWAQFVDADDGLRELRGEFVTGDEVFRLFHHHTHLLQVE